MHTTSPSHTIRPVEKTTLRTKTTMTEYPCDELYERRCSDGTCYARRNLCPEEEVVNKNTVLIMIVVGVAVTVFVVVLYCVQQKRRARNTAVQTSDGDNESLNQPPPSYTEVMTTNLYPPTPNRSLNSVHDDAHATHPPGTLTPPPTYVTALQILSRSQEYLSRLRRRNMVPIVRRSVSVDRILSKSFRDWSPPPPITPLDADNVFFNSTPHVPLSTRDSLGRQTFIKTISEGQRNTEVIQENDEIDNSSERNNVNGPNTVIPDANYPNGGGPNAAENYSPLSDVNNASSPPGSNRNPRCASTDTQTTTLSLAGYDHSLPHGISPSKTRLLQPQSAPVSRGSNGGNPKHTVFFRSPSIGNTERFNLEK